VYNCSIQHSVKRRQVRLAPNDTPLPRGNWGQIVSFNSPSSHSGLGRTVSLLKLNREYLAGNR
jgi:hypothetical protein